MENYFPAGENLELFFGAVCLPLTGCYPTPASMNLWVSHHPSLSAGSTWPPPSCILYSFLVLSGCCSVSSMQHQLCTNTGLRTIDSGGILQLELHQGWEGTRLTVSVVLTPPSCQMKHLSWLLPDLILCCVLIFLSSSSLPPKSIRPSTSINHFIPPSK